MGEKDLIANAKAYEKSHQWEMASDCYRRHLTLHGDSSSFNVRVAYARCLRHIGDADTAANILNELAYSYSGNEVILLEKSALHEGLMDWFSAEQAIQQLIQADPENPEYYFRLGRALVGLKRLDSAKKAYQTGLAFKHTIPYTAVIDQIRSALPENTVHVESSYHLIGGLDNLGALIHETGSKKYFTKIVKRGKNRERLFYEGLLAKHSQLQEICPNYLGSQEIDGILYLTMEMLQDPPELPDFSEIIKISQTISTVHYSDMYVEYPNPSYRFQLAPNTPTVVKGFAHIHEQRHNQSLFETLHRLARSAKESETAEWIIESLENLIMENRLYALISPETHYTLLHGDFKPGNIMLDLATERVRIIDWQGFRLGPRFMDVVKYAVHAKIPYARIRSEYLFAVGPEQLSTIEKIFFLYAYILMVLLTSMRKSLDSGLATFIRPALNDMSTCASRLKSEEFGPSVQLTADRISSLQIELSRKEAETDKLSGEAQVLNKKLHALKRENTLLTHANQRSRRRLKNLQASRSWRLTAPLRRLATLVDRLQKHEE